jgi:hypothetical protein
MKHRFRLSGTILLLATTFAAAAPLTAQATVGVSLGATVATFEGDDAVEGLDSKTGFMAGAHLAYPLGEIVSIVPGAYFVQKGAARGDESQTISYLELPVLLSVSVLQEDRPVGLDLFAGPEVAFKVGCSQDIEGEGDECEDEEDLSGTDFGFIAGAGLSYDRFFLNAGLDLGLKGLDDSPEDNDVKNSAWFVSAGVAFPIGR